MTGLLQDYADRSAAERCAPGDRVGLLVPKSPAAIVAMHAVLKAGGVYVPLDAESPAQRLARIVEAAEPRRAAGGAGGDRAARRARRGAAAAAGVVRGGGADLGGARSGGARAGGLGPRRAAAARARARRGPGSPAVHVRFDRPAEGRRSRTATRPRSSSGACATSGSGRTTAPPATLFAELEAANVDGTLVRRLVRADDGRPLGSYVAYVAPQGVAETIQLAAAEPDVPLVLEHLAAVHSGRALLTRLDGEWWLRPDPFRAGAQAVRAARSARSSSRRITRSANRPAT